MTANLQNLLLNSMILTRFSYLLLPLISLIAGILCQSYCRDPLIYAIIPTIFFVGTLWLKNVSIVSLFIRCFFPCLWFLIGAWRYEQQEAAFRQFNLFAKNSLYNVVGIVEDKKKDSNTIIISLQSFNNLCLPMSLKNKKIKIYTDNTNNADIGDTICCSSLRCYTKNSLQKKQLLLRTGLLASTYLGHGTCHISYRPTWCFKRWLYHKKCRLRSDLKTKMSASTFSLFESLFLGFRTSYHEYYTIKNSFQYWGIVHYLARSGLHLVVVSFFWQALLSVIPMSFMLKNIIILFFIIFYALTTQISISFIRSLLFFIIYLLCSISNVAPYRLHIIILTGLVILIINPLDLFFLDFQLSFALTFFIAFFTRHNKTSTHFFTNY